MAAVAPAATALEFKKVMMGSAQASNEGQLKVHPGGLLWRKQGGSKLVDIKKEDIKGIDVAKVPRGLHQLTVHQTNGKDVMFYGFQGGDMPVVSGHALTHFGIETGTKEYNVKGHNWGEAKLDQGATLRFEAKDGKPAFEFPLADIATAAVTGKTDLQIGFHTDDTGTEKDSLVELTFYVPQTSKEHVANDEGNAAATLHEKLLAKADIGATVGEAVAEMPDLYVNVPRGRFTAEMHTKFVKLMGTANEFKVQYSSMLRIFVLPRPASGGGGITYVNVALDPPIRKGQTYYPHLLLQFPTEDVTDVEIDMEADELEKYGGKLEASYSEPAADCFAKILRGLSNTKITRPKDFNSAVEGQAIRCSFKTDEGMLFPLDKSFFYAPKPPILVLYEDVEYVEFQRQEAAGNSASSRTFDLLVRLKSDSEYLFRSIHKAELSNLFNFFNAKKLRIVNFDSAKAAVEGKAAPVGDDDDDSDDDSSGDEDEDFGSGDESERSDDDDSGSGSDSGSDASEDGKPAKKKAKRSPTKKSPKKSPKKKAPKDPDAPMDVAATNWAIKAPE